MRYKLNILSLGDLQAKSLGLNPVIYRLVFIFLSSMVVSVSVAVCGQVCWVGLVMPHIARTLVGPNHEQMLPVAVLSGGIFLLLADTAARSLTMAELPISVVTAFIGAPLFAYLLYRNRGSGWS
jgi:iron complex transport system permease protein